MISRDQLDNEGVDVSVVVDEMVATLADQQLYASAPSWDGKWLSALLRAAGHPRNELRLGKSDEAFKDIAKEVAGSSVSDKDIDDLVRHVIECTESDPPHRALPDAVLELERWKLVRAEARKMANRL